MNREYIESGILELYVFGRLTDAENAEVTEMAQKHTDINAEMIAIEKAVINLSYSVAPYLSAENYERIRQLLIIKHTEEKPVIQMKPRSNVMSYMGWAAAVLLLIGFGFQYNRNNELVEEAQAVKTESSKYKQLLADVTIKNDKTEQALAIIRDKSSRTIVLEGQEAAPESYARVYVNAAKKEMHVDISGLPQPPQGMVYQVWALKLNPLTPTSIGVLDETKLQQNKGILPIDNFDEAEGFGITLEPAGGSPTPTMTQLYTLGKV